MILIPQKTKPCVNRIGRFCWAACTVVALSAGAQTSTQESGGLTPSGPVRLRQPVATADPSKSTAPTATAPPIPRRTALGEFEQYVRTLTGGAEIKRFGADLATAGMGMPSDGTDYNPVVPPDYILRAGDELIVTIWGSVDADLRVQVDRSGRIVIPRVGPIMVSGVRYADLPDVISRKVGLVFKNYQISVSLGQLRGVRAYITGFVDRPGPIVVNSLSTLMQALLRSGGPSLSGSYRNIQLRRGGSTVAILDLYDLLLRGDRSADQLVQADDVVYVGPVGGQVAMIGSVNRPAIFEVKTGETVDDLLRMAGGYSAVADRSRLAIERLDERATLRVTQFDQPLAGKMPLTNGDVLRAFNAVESLQPMLRQNTRVRVEGEVVRPGEYILPPASSVADALRAAGGTTQGAFLFATEFTRESVKETQQRNYDRALQDFETQLTRSSSTQRTGTAEESAAAAVAANANSRLIEQLRSLRPNGRIVLQTGPYSDTLPDLALENGDRIYIPPRPKTIGVFGSVFSAGSYLHSDTRTVGDYLRLAGGPTRGADESSIFVIRANGTVSSSLQESGYFSRGNQLAGLVAEPGDTIFVPEELNKTTWVQGAKDWTQIFYQFGVGVAALRSSLR